MIDSKIILDSYLTVKELKEFLEDKDDKALVLLPGHFEFYTEWLPDIDNQIMLKPYKPAFDFIAIADKPDVVIIQ